MSFPKLMMGLPKPETAEDIKSQATLDGMRKAIEIGSRDSNLIRQCLDTARYGGLNGEDTYVLLAYQALLALETYYQHTQKFVQLSPVLPDFLKEPR